MYSIDGRLYELIYTFLASTPVSIIGIPIRIRGILFQIIGITRFIRGIPL